MPAVALASSIVSQVGSASSNYDVSYDTNSGALNIAHSANGASSGIQSISSDTSGFIETAPARTTGLTAMNIFTSDGTANGATILNVTVGSLTTANLGKSNGRAGSDLSHTNLNSQASAASALNLITTAVNGISSQRGTVEANINQLFGDGQRHRDRADQSEVGIELHPQCQHRQDGCQYDSIQYSAIDWHGRHAAVQSGTAGYVEAAPVNGQQTGSRFTLQAR